MRRVASFTTTAIDLLQFHFKLQMDPKMDLPNVTMIDVVLNWLLISVKC